MSETYEAWSDEDEKIVEDKKNGLMSENAKHLHTIEANSWDEAMTENHLRMGFESF